MQQHAASDHLLPLPEAGLCPPVLLLASAAGSGGDGVGTAAANQVRGPRTGPPAGKGPRALIRNGERTWTSSCLSLLPPPSHSRPGCPSCHASCWFRSWPPCRSGGCHWSCRHVLCQAGATGVATLTLFACAGRRSTQQVSGSPAAGQRASARSLLLDSSNQKPDVSCQSARERPCD